MPFSSSRRAAASPPKPPSEEIQPQIKRRLITDSLLHVVHQSNSETETRAIAARFAGELKPGVVLLLSGDLGAGKTAFTKGLAEGLGVDPGEVTSPTFTLVHEYRGGRLPLVHVDLYRLEKIDLDELGMDADLADQGVLAIEWSDRLVRLPVGAVSVTIVASGEDSRTITIVTPHSRLKASAPFS